MTDWRPSIAAGGYLLTALVVLLCGATIADAQVQSRDLTEPREILLGVSRPQRPAIVQSSGEQEAARLYGEASAAIRSGKVYAAQRQLEQLVVVHPDTQSATRARADLAAIYNSNVTPRPVSLGQPSYLGRTTSDVPAPPPAITSWRTTVNPPSARQKSMQDDLRAKAGDLVFFSEGSAELGARARKALGQQADWLKLHPELVANVEGHADEAGGASDLKALSIARAEAVRARLIEEGVAPERIRTFSYGAERPVALCADRSCAGQNRRVTTIVTGGSLAQVPAR